MKKLLSLTFFAISPLAFAQQSAKDDIGNMYFLGIGLAIFLAGFAVYTLFEKIRERHEDEVNELKEEIRKLRIENRELDTKLKAGSAK